jgi:hypothetical protein
MFLDFINLKFYFFFKTLKKTNKKLIIIGDSVPALTFSQYSYQALSYYNWTC